MSSCQSGSASGCERRQRSSSSSKGNDAACWVLMLACSTVLVLQQVLDYCDGLNFVMVDKAHMQKPGWQRSCQLLPHPAPRQQQLIPLTPACVHSLIQLST
jgi:hypothetical protein